MVLPETFIHSTVNAAVEMKRRRRAKPGEERREARAGDRPPASATGLPLAQPRGCFLLTLFPFPVIAESALSLCWTHTQQKQENMLGKVVFGSSVCVCDGIQVE